MAKIDLKSWVYKFRLLIILIGLISILSIVSPSFLTARNFYNVFLSVSVLGIMAVGSTFVILVAGIDLSVATIAALAGVIVAKLMISKNIDLTLVIFLTLLAGAFIGFINGLIVTISKIPDFIVTLSTMNIINGITMILTSGESISFLQQQSYLVIGGGRIFSVPIPVYILIFIMLIGYLLLNQSIFGRQIYAVGGNKIASTLSGISINRIKILAYICSGFTAALGGIVLSSMIQQANPLMASGYELDVIAAIVIGGSSLFGGEGTIQGTIFGTLLIGFINNGLNLLNVPSPYHPVVKGVIIIIVVASNSFSRRATELHIKKIKN